MSGQNLLNRALLWTLLWGLSLVFLGCAQKNGPKNDMSHLAEVYRGHWQTPDGLVLPVRSWWPNQERPKAIIIAVHGFNDYGNAFKGAGVYFSSQGFALLAYDQRGFGLSPGFGNWAGDQAYIDDLDNLIRTIKRRYPESPLFILGESMGAAIAIACVTEANPPPVEGVILSAPAVWSRDLMPWYQSALLSMLAATAPGLELTGSGLKIQASDNIPMLRGLGQDPRVIKSTRVDAIDGLTDLMDRGQERAGDIPVPVLVLYGEKDQVIPKGPVFSMIKKIPLTAKNKVALYPSGYHLLLRDLRADIPLKDMVSWVQNPLSPLPSGFEKPLPLH